MSGAAGSAAGAAEEGAGSIVYALIARGATVLAEHTSKSGNFQQVTRTILEKFVDSQDGGRHSYAYDDYLFHIATQDGLIFLTMTTTSFERRVAFAFLDDIREAFMAKFSGAIESAVAYEMNKPFEPVLKDKMVFYTSNPKADKLRHIKEEVTEVRQVMVENIERILDRGDKIELLVDKAEDLNEQATKFKRSGHQLKNKMWWSQVKLQSMICGGVAVVLFFIILTSTNCFGQC
mmetsp:Transcript_20280/g.49790  ORF Transcript_20280/g.49790 Transcript_20280/m.49790 type:complete len:234 (-) Transcript_20280:297-998(-)